MLEIDKVKVGGTKLDASKVIGTGLKAKATLDTILLLQRQRLGFSEPVRLSDCGLTQD